MKTSDPSLPFADRYRRNGDVAVDVLPLSGDSSLAIAYCPALCDKQLINKLLLPSLKSLYRDVREPGPPELETHVAVELVPIAADRPDEADTLLFEGSAIVALPGMDGLYAFRIPDIPRRQTEETNIEVSIRGPKDGLVEAIDVNFGLIRRRMPVRSVVFETFRVGSKTKTKVGLIYDEDKIDPDILRDIRGRLAEIDDRIEELVSSAQLEELISDSPFSLFPLSVYTGRPDFITSCVLRGRFAILIDGVPGAMVAPISLSMLLKTPEDTHFNYATASFGQLLRTLSLIVSIFLPGFYIALTGYHQDQIPFPLLATIITTRIGIPLSTPMEMFLVLTLLETFKEAGFRLPSMIGQTLTVVGGLIIGDAAIRAGLISPSMVVVAAISIVAGSTLISQTLSGSVSILRYLSVILSAVLGMYGFMLSVLLLVVYLTGLKSFGVPFLSPVAPISPRDIGRAFLKYPIKMKSFVPRYLRKRS